MTARDDGRNIDPEVGILEGEASGQAVPEARDAAEGAAPFEVWDREPTRDGRDTTYYDRPVLKEPVWIWAVPAYFYLGGTAGAASVLGSAAQARDRDRLAGLVRRCRWLSAVGVAAGTALLVHDLGRPARFLNMLRVFRPTSPLNVGSWVLATAAPATGAAALLSGRRDGVLKGVGDAAGHAAGVLGLPMSGYTAVLLANTAVPAWQGAGRALPALFVASSVSGAASLLELMDLTEDEEKVVGRFGVAGKVAEVAAMSAVERETGRVERVARPLREGLSATLWKAARAMTAGSLALSLLPGRSKGKRVASGILGTAGAVALRFAVWHAGRVSSRDPRATFQQQRAGLGAAEATGTPAVTGPGDRRAL
ncbi:MAG: NrfD/PsrC family molybdoenzyme membrane anchor subunit [Actinomycetota bacterium]